MSGLPSLPAPVYSCREEKECPFLDSQALTDREKQFSLWVSVTECTILHQCFIPYPPKFLCMCNQQEQLRQLPYPVPIGLRQEDLDLDLEEEESGDAPTVSIFYPQLPFCIGSTMAAGVLEEELGSVVSSEFVWGAICTKIQYICDIYK